MKYIPRHGLDGNAGGAGSPPHRFHVRRRRGIEPVIVVDTLEISEPGSTNLLHMAYIPAFDDRRETERPLIGGD